jgi:hypothetical protein
MGLNCAAADTQSPGDAAVGLTIGDKLEYTGLARRQQRTLRRTWRRGKRWPRRERCGGLLDMNAQQVKEVEVFCAEVVTMPVQRDPN